MTHLIKNQQGRGLPTQTEFKDVAFNCFGNESSLSECPQVPLAETLSCDGVSGLECAGAASGVTFFFLFWFGLVWGGGGPWPALEFSPGVFWCG